MKAKEAEAAAGAARERRARRTAELDRARARLQDPSYRLLHMTVAALFARNLKVNLRAVLLEHPALGPHRSCTVLCWVKSRSSQARDGGLQHGHVPHSYVRQPCADCELAEVSRLTCCTDAR